MPDEPAPVLLADEEDLAKAFAGARDHAATWRAFLELQPCVVWHTTWNMDLDGLNETRASVAHSADGYLPGLEVSHRGGDCAASFEEALPTLEQAIERAKDIEHEWHLDAAAQ